MADTADAGASGTPRKVPAVMVSAWETATSDPDPLIALGAARALATLLSTWEGQLAKEAVAAGETWEAIGGTVGVSRQAAWERFHREVQDVRRQARADLADLRSRHREEAAELRRRIKEEVRSRARGH